jgi:hypothetical protein
MELGSPWVCGHIHPNTIPKALLPIFFGSAKKNHIFPKDTQPKKEKRKEKEKERRRQGNKHKRKRKELEKYRKKSKRQANSTVESCIGSFWLITLGFLEIESS